LAAGPLEDHIQLEGPLDVEATLYSGQAFRWRRGDQGWHDGFVRNHPVRIRKENDELRWRSARPMKPQHMAHYFRLDDSHDAFLRSAPRDPFLQTALARFPGLRLLRQDPWEIFISFIISQNSNEAKIRRTIEDLCRRAGPKATFDNQTLHAFPPPARLAALSEKELRATGMGYRAPFIHAAANLVATGTLEPHRWATRPYEDVFGELLEVPGIGEKVADCILLYGCDHRRAFPSDVWVRRFVKETYLRTRSRTSHSAIRDFAWRHFGEDAGYAQHYLFHYRRRVGALAASPS